NLSIMRRSALRNCGETPGRAFDDGLSLFLDCKEDESIVEQQKKITTEHAEQVSVLEAKVAALEEELSKKSTDLETKVKEIEEYKTKIETLMKEVRKLKEMKEQLIAQNAELNITVKLDQQNAIRLKEEISTLQRKLAEVEEVKTQLDAELLE